MGIEHVVAESGMMDELMVDEVGERSRYTRHAADERSRPCGHLEAGYTRNGWSTVACMSIASSMAGKGPGGIEPEDDDF